MGLCSDVLGLNWKVELGRQTKNESDATHRASIFV